MATAAGSADAAFLQSLTLDHVSPATRLLEKRRQMFEVQEALDAQKEEFARREVRPRARRRCGGAAAPPAVMSPLCLWNSVV